MFFPDSDTGYCESEADLSAQVHEEAEEAEFRAEYEPDYRALAIGMIYASHDIGMVPIPEKKEAA